MDVRRNAHRRYQTNRSGERGQAMALFAVMMVALVGMVGLVIDGSNFQENHRKLQNAADAAAMAGAYDLPSNSSQANTDAVQWLTKNGSSNTEVTGIVISSSHDSITVSLRRTVPSFISQVIGFGSATISASATVNVQSATGATMPTDDSQLCLGENICPYAVWAYRNDSQQDLHQVGDLVTYEATDWIGQNVWPGSQYWGGNSNSFKGYLRPEPSNGNWVNVGDLETQSKGGVACGQQPIDQLQQAYNNKQPILLPVYDNESGNGKSTLHLAGFAMLNINYPGATPPQCPQTMQGQIMKFVSASSLLQRGGTQPPSWISCTTGFGICIPVITQ